jgi:hypothetical protein
MRIAPVITLSAEQRTALESQAQSRTSVAESLAPQLRISVCLDVVHGPLS